MRWTGTPYIAKPVEDARILAQRLKRRPRILLAEDDWSFRDLLLFALHECGCDVVAARDGQTLHDALARSLPAQANEGSFDLLISDVRMPGFLGLPGLFDLIANPRVPPVVIITAFGSDELHESARKAGAVAVLDKPFDVGDLAALAMDIIEQGQRAQGN